MARGNIYTCLACGKKYDFCPKCAFTAPTYDAENFCSDEHNKIFAILSKHGCNLATAEKTLEALADYDTTNVAESIRAHIDSLQPKKVATEKEVEVTPKKSNFRTQE